jgi:hypothetical protein
MKLTFKNGQKECLVECESTELEQVAKHLPALLVAASFHDLQLYQITPPAPDLIGPNSNPWWPRMGPGTIQTNPPLDPVITYFSGVFNGSFDKTWTWLDGRKAPTVKDVFGCDESCPD